MATQQKSTSRYILTTLSTILVLTALVLVGLNALEVIQNGGFSKQKSADQLYAEGYNAARAKYRDLCPLLTSGVHSFSGIVQSNNGTSLVVVQRTLDTDPRVDGVKNERTITISGNTNIQKLSQKDPVQFTAELQAYAKDPKKGQTPQPSTTIQLKAGDLKPGQSVYIESAADLRLLEMIPATLIRAL